MPISVEAAVSLGTTVPSSVHWVALSQWLFTAISQRLSRAQSWTASPECYLKTLGLEGARDAFENLCVRQRRVLELKPRVGTVDKNAPKKKAVIGAVNS